MSWGEVKKINSDLSVPLNDRMSYYYGLIPRNNISRTLSGSIPTSNNGYTQEVSAKIDGSGCITGINLRARGNGDDPHYQSASGTAKITLIADGVTHVYSASFSAGPTASLDSKLSISMSLGDVRSCIELEDNISVSNNEKVSLTQNRPLIEFNDSLDISISLSGSKGSYASCAAEASITYMLYER